MNKDICRELSRSASQETRSCVHEELIVEEVEEWIASAAVVDFEWLFRCHGCSGQERTYKYFQLFSVKCKEKDEEYLQRLVL